MELTLRNGARQLLRIIAGLDDPRPARAYAQRVIAAGAGQVKASLVVSDAAAIGVVAWAQGVIDSLNGQDVAKTNAAAALTEIG